EDREHRRHALHGQAMVDPRKSVCCASHGWSSARCTTRPIAPASAEGTTLLTAALPECYHHRSAEDQGTSEDYPRGRGDSKTNPVDHLSDKKEEGDIDAEEAPEIPGRQIDNHTIGEQDDGAAGEKAQAGRQRRAMKSCANQGIAPCLERGRRHQQQHPKAIVHDFPPVIGSAILGYLSC